MLYSLAGILPQIIVGDSPLQQMCCLSIYRFCQFTDCTNIAFSIVGCIEELVEAMELITVHAASIVELDIGLLDSSLYSTCLTTLECEVTGCEVNRLVVCFFLDNLHLNVSDLNNLITMLQQNTYDWRTAYSCKSLSIAEYLRSQYATAQTCKVSLVSIVCTNLVVLHQLILEAHA